MSIKKRTYLSLVSKDRHVYSQDYQTQSWKNGLGTTSEISIYPPEKDYRQDSFFWRLSENKIDADFNFPILLGYEW